VGAPGITVSINMDVGAGLTCAALQNATLQIISPGQHG
jgi:hypothetical protein